MNACVMCVSFLATWIICEEVEYAVLGVIIMVFVFSVKNIKNIP